MSETAAILLAGGSGSRAHPTRNKLHLPIRGRSVLAYSLETLLESPCIDRVVVVTRAEDSEHTAALVARTDGTTAVVLGGVTRHRSEHCGLEALSSDIEAGRIDVVAIHDAARPFASLDLIAAVVGAARAAGGGIPGLPVTDPVFSRGSDGSMHPTARSELRRVQTPQAFRAVPLLDAYRSAAAAGFEGVDTAETVERHSHLDVVVVPGDTRNVKVTFAEDFDRAEETAADWSRGKWIG